MRQLNVSCNFKLSLLLTGDSDGKDTFDVSSFYTSIDEKFHKYGDQI